MVCCGGVLISPPPILIARPTRGDGTFEGLLARWRIHIALQAICPHLQNGDVLDLGCGNHPLFLLKSKFRRKVGMDQVPLATVPIGIEFLDLVVGEARLPFPDRSFDCVTALAFMEHLEPEALPFLLSEVRRVLKPSGQFIATTPHALADRLLRQLARLNLVSQEEINEHKTRFWKNMICGLLLDAGFKKKKISISGFQLGLNLLAVAQKD
jgi:SAM-dependent methyltransferase